MVSQVAQESVDLLVNRAHQEHQADPVHPDEKDLLVDQD